MLHAALNPAMTGLPEAARHTDHHRVRLLLGAGLVATLGGLLAIALFFRLADAGAVPSAPPVAKPAAVVWDGDPSVPDAATALAGRAPSLEETEPAPTF